MSISFSSSRSGSGKTDYDDEDCPDYDAVVSDSSRSDTPTIGSNESVSVVDNSLRLSRLSLPRRHTRQPTRYERYVYTYRLLANAPMQFMISVEPQNGLPLPGKYTFRLTLKTNGVERQLCEPATRILSVDPRLLEFVVFTFPGKPSLPAGCLWSLRVWLRVNGIDHRIFADDELWVGRDPDFSSIAEASFARLKSAEGDRQLYNGYVGKALVTFIVKWKHIGGNLYKYSMGYEANGVGDLLFDDFRLRLDDDPQSISFVIFSLPSNSIPPGASHKLRIWIRSLSPLTATSPQPTSYVLPFNDSYVYQRIWKTDTFKMGARLDFESLGVRMVMGFSSGGPETISTAIPMSGPPLPVPMDIASPITSTPKEKRHGYGIGYDLNH